MQPDIIIYYTNICTLCTKTIEFLRSRNLDFHAKPVLWDETADAFQDTPHARDMMRRCGKTVDFVPQIFIGNTHIAGWRKLEPMIQDGSLDRLLE